MDRVRKMLHTKAGYEPVQDATSTESLVADTERDTDVDDVDENPFSKVEYAIFLLLGVAMLWAWNMFLAAAPYFQKRFESNQRILDSFQAAEISVSTVTNLTSMVVLTKMQANASYPRRIITSLSLTIISFLLLTISTAIQASATAYFAFLMIMVALSSFCAGLIQNGLFAFASGYGRSEYIQGIMTGQAVAGVLPCVAQIISVVSLGPPKKEKSLPPKDGEGGPPSTLPPSASFKSARIYFIVATSVASLALVAFIYLLHHHKRATPTRSSPLPNPTSSEIPTEGSLLHPPSEEDLPEQSPPKTIPLTRLFMTIPSLSVGVFLCFSITMIFPVFTAIVTSVNPSSLPPQIFIPLSFLLWNLGDLAGRLVTIFPSLHLYHHPFSLFCLSMARLVFVPLYLLCNLRGQGAIVNSDVFYLIVVQFLFGLSNGYLGSECMMGAGEWVNGAEEKKAVGAWMGLCLVGGLTVGSLCSFAVVGAV